MPFMDVELARLAARMPDRFLSGGRGGKRILRAAMRKVLPPEILTRRKIGFRVPLAQWFRTRCRDELRDMLTSENSSVARLCDPAALQRLLNEHLDERRDNERMLWTLANLEMFLRTFRPDGIAEATDTTARRAA
jgi:asparagine synthase (glutamine-hydrolysing)